MKKILFLTLIIALIILSACSSQTSDPIHEQDIEAIIHKEEVEIKPTPTTPTVVTPTEMPGDLAKCEKLSVYELQDKCRAIENRDIEACAQQPKINHLQECVLEVAKFSFDKAKAKDCSVLKDVQLKITCEALLKQDVNVCLTIPKAFGASEQMRDCVNLVATKMENKQLCNTFISQKQSFIDACLQNCYTRWDGVNAENHKATCEEKVVDGFTPLY
jgi:hypothetical protein